MSKVKNMLLEKSCITIFYKSSMLGVLQQSKELSIHALHQRP